MNDVTKTRQFKDNAVAQQKGEQSGQGDQDRPALHPPVDVLEDASGITLYADMPGVPREHLNVHVEGDDMLVIEGELGLELPQDMQANHAEVGRSRYRRQFTLSKELDASKVSAELKHGVLKLRIPKSEQAQPRRITVNAG
jgi:HSP20 family molecular chaperone IbpA